MRRRLSLGPFPHVSLAVGVGLLVVAVGVGSGGGAVGRSRAPAISVVASPLVTPAPRPATTVARPVVTAAPRPGALPAPTAVARAVAFALAQVGKPYRFGTAGPGSFDCSGLTLAAFGTIGVRLPHKAAWQARLGSAIDWRRVPLRPGDLVFTKGGRPRRDLGHVGLAVSATEWVVAPSPGRTVTRQPIPFGRVQEVRRLLPG